MIDRQEARQADHAARLEAQTNFHLPMVLEAGAGTGKTATLVARVLVWALGPGWDLSEEAITAEVNSDDDSRTDRIAARVMERIVAITFTERAAEEMAHRVATGLDCVRAERSLPGLMDNSMRLPSQEKIRRSTALLEHVDRLSVQTIHAFCRSLLAQAPLDVGLHPSFQVDADGRALEQIVEEVVARYLNSTYSAALSPDLQTVMAAGLDPHHLAFLLQDLAANAIPAQALSVDPYGTDQVARLRDDLHHTAQHVLAQIETPLETTTATRIDAALNTLDQVRSWIRLLERNPTIHDLVDGFATPEAEKALKRLHGWGKGTWTKGEESSFGDVVNTLPQGAAALRELGRHVARLAPDVLPALCRILHPLYVEIEERMTSQGVVTFSGLMRHAHTLLSNHAPVRTRCRRSMDQLLIDEFQDTDPLQCNLVRMLALEGALEERPGLFIVGDPKQSIYGWRKADLNAYESFVQQVINEGGVRRSLTVNFRSVPAILDEVERIMAPVMHYVPGISPAFETLLPSEENTDKKGFYTEKHRPVEYWPSWDHVDGVCHIETRADRARQIEAEALALDMKSLHEEESIAYKKMAVLMRATSDIDTYLSAFRKFSIPFVVERDRNYFQRREIIDATSLVRTLFDPNDHVALVSLLRAPFVGVPDAALLALWNRGFPGQLSRLTSPAEDVLNEIRETIALAAKSLPADVPGIARIDGWENSLRHAVDAIAFLRAAFETTPTDEFVSLIRSLFMQEITESARYLGGHRLANLERFYRILAEDLSDPSISTSTLVSRLRTGVQKQSPQQEGSPGDASADAVRVLTIHKAKGLTFDHVYVVGLHSKRKANQAYEGASVDEIDGEYAISLATLPSANFHLVDAAQHQTEIAEMTRTLYVALTRPAKRLVLLGRWPGDPSPPSDNPTSHLELLGGRAADLSMGELAASSEGQGTLTFDKYDTLWRVPPPPSDDPWRPAEDNDVPVISVEEAKAEQQIILTKRKEAALRISLPLLETPSGMAHEGGPPSTPNVDLQTTLDRRQARAIGIAIHRVLETFNLSNEFKAECDRQRDLLPVYLRPLVPETLQEETCRVAYERLDILISSSLLERLKEVEILGREVPFFDSIDADEMTSPGVVVGGIDLIYREDDEVVVVDYKTDRVFSDAEIQARAAVYATQGHYYCQAVKKALDLDALPPFELWFLLPGRSIRA